MLTAQGQHYLNSPNMEATQNGVLMLKVAIYLVQDETAVPQWGEMVTGPFPMKMPRKMTLPCPPCVMVRLGPSFCESSEKPQI